jgi:hypothetical protein
MAHPALNHYINVEGCTEKSPSKATSNVEGCTAESPNKVTPPEGLLTWRKRVVGMTHTSGLHADECFNAADPPVASGSHADTACKIYVKNLSWRITPIVYHIPPPKGTAAEAAYSSPKGTAAEAAATVGAETNATTSPEEAAAAAAAEAATATAGAAAVDDVAMSPHADDDATKEEEGGQDARASSGRTLGVTPLSGGMGHSRGRVAVGYQGTESLLATKLKLWKRKCFNCCKLGHLAKDCNQPSTWPPTKKA